MANKVTMTICGQEYTLVADESAAYMEQVGTLVNQRMRQTQETLRVSRADAAVLAGILLLILCGGAESLRAIVLCGAAGCVLIGAGAAALEKDGD